MGAYAPFFIMIEVTLEVEYLYRGFKDKTATGWMYPTVKGKDVTECIEKGKDYFQKQVRGLGWTKITDLVEVRRMRHGSESTTLVAADDLAGRSSGRISTSSKATERPAATTTANRTAATGTPNPKKRGKNSGDGGSPKRKKPAAKSTKTTKRS